jgi:oxalate decarboxylase/phosphoglucose isomerase-like protein (cupin superfamily)
MFPGDCIYAPRGSVHAFKNKTDQPIRVFINMAPAGFERFLAEQAEELAKPEPNMSRVTAIAEKYGLYSA